MPRQISNFPFQTKAHKQPPPPPKATTRKGVTYQDTPKTILLAPLPRARRIVVGAHFGAVYKRAAFLGGHFEVGIGLDGLIFVLLKWKGYVTRLVLRDGVRETGSGMGGQEVNGGVVYVLWRRRRGR
jgi:hypothetical protein